jgi:hypothetical protein
MHPEEAVWTTIDPNDMWVLDKLILSKKLGYRCGPVGINVPKPDYYIVRPCVNALGLGLGTEKLWLEDTTDHLPLGFFWCEFFEGRHLSVDFLHGKQTLTVEGHKAETTFTQWNEWIVVDDIVPLPSILADLANKYVCINCEFINGKLIEAHLRPNVDFESGETHFIPVWEGNDITPPAGYSYRSYPDLHGRIGAFVK